MPNLVIMCSWMKLAMAAPIALRRGMASTHFEKYSVVTKIQMYLPGGGLMGPIRSSPQVWKGYGVAMFCRLNSRESIVVGRASSCLNALHIPRNGFLSLLFEIRLS